MKSSDFFLSFKNPDKSMILNGLYLNWQIDERDNRLVE